MDALFFVLLVLMPALFWTLLWWFRDHEKEPFLAMVLAFVFGGLVPLLLLALYQFAPAYGDFSQLWYGVFVHALLEEVFKALLLILCIEFTHRWFTQIVDGVVYGAVIGLGFAFVENLFYLWPLYGSGAEFSVLYLLRSLNTMVAHSLFTGLFGFFYASAYLRDEIFPEKKREKPWQHFWKNLWEALPFHVTLMHILPNRPSGHGHYPGSLILEGILVASLLHGAFNLVLTREFFGMDWSFLTFPLVFGMGYVVWQFFLHDVYVQLVKRLKS